MPQESNYNNYIRRYWICGHYKDSHVALAGNIESEQRFSFIVQHFIPNILQTNHSGEVNVQHQVDPSQSIVTQATMLSCKFRHLRGAQPTSPSKCLCKPNSSGWPLLALWSASIQFGHKQFDCFFPPPFTLSSNSLWSSINNMCRI